MKKVIVFLFFVFTGQSLYPIIHYKYVNERVYTGSPRYYDMDFNGDDDFSFHFYSSSLPHYYINSEQPYNYFASWGCDPKAYNYGADTGNVYWCSPWIDPVQDSDCELTGTSGKFNNVTKYLLVKFKNGTNTFYGWFLVKHITEGDSLWIVSYAYNDIADEPVTAGQGDPATIVAELTDNHFPFVLNKLSENQIVFQNCDDFDEVSIYTITGELLSEIEQPIALQYYPIKQDNDVLIIAFFNKGRLLYSSPYLVNKSFF